MLKRIIKRDGSIEEFTPSKVNGWGIWASKTLNDRVDWGSVVIEAVGFFGEEITSKKLQLKLIDICIDRGTWAYSVMGGRLYANIQHKELYDDKIPTVKELHDSLHVLGFMPKLNFTDEEYAYAQSVIDHKRDYTCSYFQLKQVIGKYSIQDRISRQPFETPQFTYMRMAMALSQRSIGQEKLDDIKAYYDEFSQNRINPPSPNYINLGTYLNGFASCCLYVTSDTRVSISIGLHIADTMTAMSAGIGGNLNIRSKGDPIRNGAIEHNGKLPYYKAIAGAIGANMQAGRGGADTTYYSVFDPEAEVIAFLQNPRATEDKKNRDMNFCVMYNRLFVKKVLKNEQIFTFNVFTTPDLVKLFYSGDMDGFEALYNKYDQDDSFKKNYVSARDRFILIDTQSFEVGTNFDCFIDEVNRHTAFKDPIHSGNLCVAPETLILTDKGYFPIISLENKEINVWNGKQWSKTKVVKTGENQRLIKVVTDSGQEIECTPYHKFYVIDEYGSEAREVRAGELKVNDKLCKFNLPIISDYKELERAYINGFYSGDGCLTKDGQRIYLYHFKRELAEYFPGGSSWIIQDSTKRMYKHYDNLEDKFFVPNEEYTVKSRLDWFSGYCDADGCVYRNLSNQQVVCTSVELEFLKKIQFMLTTLGVSSKIKDFSFEGYRSLPKNDGSGEKSLYWCKNQYRLILASNEVQSLLTLGMNNKRLILVNNTPQRSATNFIKIKEIVDQGRIDDTYCVNEPLEHKVIFNGLLTGNCLEVTQPTIPYEDMRDLYLEEDHGRGEVSLCSIGAIAECNVTSDEQYANSAYYTLKMIDECIHMSDYPLPHIGYTAKQRLNSGVGLLGVATTMARKKLSWTTKEGKEEIHRIAERHSYFVIKASLRLAKERGVCPWAHKTKWADGWLPIDTYKKTVDQIVVPIYIYDWETLRSEIVANGGIRNSGLISHMPTESSSKAIGAPNSIYPVRMLSGRKRDGEKQIDWVALDSDLLKEDYELAYTIPSQHITEGYAIYQKFADQAISIDEYIDRRTDATLSTDKMIEHLAHKAKFGQKSRYYIRQLTSDKEKLEVKADLPSTTITLPEQEEGCVSGACSL
jgi:ribonucleoside-diphosphate reductase alpha chain